MFAAIQLILIGHENVVGSSFNVKRPNGDNDESKGEIKMLESLSEQVVSTGFLYLFSFFHSQVLIPLTPCISLPSRWATIRSAAGRMLSRLGPLASVQPSAHFNKQLRGLCLR